MTELPTIHALDSSLRRRKLTQLTRAQAWNSKKNATATGTPQIHLLLLFIMYNTFPTWQLQINPFSAPCSQRRSRHYSSGAPIPTLNILEKTVLKKMEQRKYQKKTVNQPTPGRKTTGLAPYKPMRSCQMRRKGMKNIKETFIDCLNILD